MKKSVLAIFTLVIPVCLMAQYSGQAANYNSGSNGGNSDAFYNYAVGSVSDRSSKTAYDLDKIQGSPYVANSFLPTTLYYKNEKVQDIYYRYNAYNEEVEMKGSILPEAPVQGLARDKNIHIVVDGKKLAFHTFIDKTGLTQNGYLLQLNEGDYIFYKRIKVKFTEGQRALNSLTKATPPRFSKFDEYYLEVKGENKIQEVLLRNSKFLKALPKEIQGKVKEMFKASKFKIKSEQDLIKAITMIQELN